MNYLTEAILGCALLGALSGVLGNFLVVRKMALLGDMIGHAVLPGVCIGFFLAAFEKNIFFIFVGALVAALAANALHEFFSNRLRIKPDASLAINLTGFYAIGSTMISWMKDSGKASQSGLDRYLLGQASSMGREDLFFFIGMSLIVALTLFLFFKEFKAACFDYDFAKASALRPQLFLMLLSSLIAATVIIGLQAVGAILSCAFLIVPAASAVFFSKRLEGRIFIGAVFGALAGSVGALLSLIYAHVPTGPAIILVSTGLFLLSGLLGPENGWLRRRLRELHDKKKHNVEDVLRCAYYFVEKQNKNFVKQDDVFERSDIRKRKLFQKILRSLVRRKVIEPLPEKSFALTTKGMTLASDMVRKHRLWELYLVQVMRFPPERVHDNAERVEHVITDSILKKIEEKLSHPNIDPHGKLIPSLRDLKDHGVPGY